MSVFGCAACGVVEPEQPAAAPAAPPRRGAAADARCAECGDAFGAGGPGSECAVELRLPGEQRPTLVHTACRATYEERRAPRCDHCGAGMAREMVVVPRPGGDARVHAGCVAAFREAAAPRCAHCRGAVTGDVAVLSDGAELHAACVAAYQRSRSPECARCGELIVAGLGVREQHPVIAGRAYHARCVACVECGAGFEQGEELLQTDVEPASGPAAAVAALQRSAPPHAALPGLAALRATRRRPAFLHARCEAAHCAARAPRCAQCDEPMLGPVARHWGEWGEARTHRGDCAAAFRGECDTAFTGVEPGAACMAQQALLEF